MYIDVDVDVDVSVGYPWFSSCCQTKRCFVFNCCMYTVYVSEARVKRSLCMIQQLILNCFIGLLNFY